MEPNLDDLRAKEKELLLKMQIVQAEVIADVGGLDQAIYRQRLSDSGLLVEFTALQKEIRKALSPPKKSENQLRKEAGQVYLRRRRPTDDL